jgi:hypothetical protein
VQRQYHVDDAEYKEANECRRKIRYSRTAAIRAAVRLKQEYGREYDVYECVFCGGYHVGKSIGNRDAVRN